MGQQTSGLHDPGLHDSEHVTTTLAMKERRPLNVSMRGLADDLLLDHILPLLDIRDIINLRRVSTGPPATRDVSRQANSTLMHPTGKLSD